MLHKEFLSKLENARKVHEAYARLKSWSAVATELAREPNGLHQVAGFYVRHKDDPQRPEWGEFSQRKVKRMIENEGEIARITGKRKGDDLKAFLFEQIGVSERLRPYWPLRPEPDDAMIKLILETVTEWKRDEDWFKDNEGKWRVHWKHGAL